MGTELEEYDISQLVEAWHTIKADLDARKKAFKAECEADEESVKTLEEEIILRLHKTKQRKITFDETAPEVVRGTCYTSMKIASKVYDAEAFFDYVMQTGETELLYRRASDTAVQEFIKANKEVPPGIQVSTTYTLNFRKAS